jgi:hypothetical protein
MTSPKRAVGTAALALLCVPTPAAPGQAPGTGPSFIDVQIRAGLLGAPTTITCEAGQAVTIDSFLDTDQPSGLVTVGAERTVVLLAPPLEDDAIAPGAPVVTYEGPRALFLESPDGGTLAWDGDGGATLACSGVPPTLVVEPEPTPRRRPSRL